MKRFPRFWLQLLGFSLFLGIAPVLTLGVLSYNKAANVIQEKVQHSHEQLLLQSQTGIEHVLSQIDFSVMQFISSPIVNASVNQALTPQSFEEYRDLRDMMGKLQLSRFGITEIFLVSREHDWYINNAGLFAYSASREKALFEPYTDLAATSAWISVSPDHQVSLVKKPPLLTYSNNPTGLMILNIDIRIVSQALNQDAAGNVILDREHRILLNRATDYGVDADTVEELTALLERQTAPSGSIKSERQRDLIFTYHKSSYTGWTYLLAASIQDMTMESKAIGWITLFTVALILSVTGVIIYFGSRRMYDPIRKLVEFVKGTQDMPGETQRNDEFSFMASRFDKLIRTGDRLKLQLDAHLPQLKEYFVLKLMLGQVRVDETEEKELLFDVHGSGWKRLAVMAFKFDSLEQTKYEEKDRDLLHFAIQNIVCDLVPAYKRLPPVLLENTQSMVVFSQQESDALFKKELHEIGGQIVESVRYFLELPVNIGISFPYGHLAGTSAAYEEALEALKFRVSLGEGVLVFLDEVKPVKPNKLEYPLQLERELIDAVRMSQTGMARKFLREFIRTITDKNVHYSDFQHVMGQLLIRITDLIKEDVSSFYELFGEESMFKPLTELSTADEMERWFENKVITPIIHVINNRREEQEGSITTEVLRMIEKEYDTNLTLELCADRLNFHPSYVSRVFKKETGTRFSDYLAQYRLGLSKEWLIDSDLKISEIADKLKYNSSAAFIRYFRKMEGMTPGQYRERTHRKT